MRRDPDRRPDDVLRDCCTDVLLTTARFGGLFFVLNLTDWEKRGEDPLLLCTTYTIRRGFIAQSLAVSNDFTSGGLRYFTL